MSPKVMPQHRELRALLFTINVWVLLRPTEFVDIEVLWDGTTGLSSLSEKIWNSSHLQKTLQRQRFLLSGLKTLSVGPA